MSSLILAKVNRAAPGFTLRLPAWCAKLPVPKVAISALTGHYCSFGSLWVVNPSPRTEVVKTIALGPLWDTCKAAFACVSEGPPEGSAFLSGPSPVSGEHIPPDCDVMLVPRRGILKEDVAACVSRQEDFKKSYSKQMFPIIGDFKEIES